MIFYFLVASELSANEHVDFRNQIRTSTNVLQYGTLYVKTEEEKKEAKMEVHVVSTKLGFNIPSPFKS